MAHAPPTQNRRPQNTVVPQPTVAHTLSRCEVYPPVYQRTPNVTGTMVVGKLLVNM